MKPILFNTEMVKSIKNNTKKVTRRVLKPHNAAKANKLDYFQGNGLWYDDTFNEFDKDTHIKDYSVSSCWIATRAYIQKYAPYKAGDILYVRETWQYAYDLDEQDHYIEESGRYIYYADNPYPFNVWIMPDGTERDHMPWKPSIHMPKEAARIFLRVTDVRVEGLQDITDEQVIAEGVVIPKTVSAEERCLIALVRYPKLWNSTVKKSDLDKYGWNANPWVTVNEFERISKEEALKNENRR